MIPKKIYLNYVDENDADKTWSEDPISASDCKMKNREYTDLSQVWHDASEEPNKRAWIISEYYGGYINIDWGNVTSGLWYGWESFVLYYDVSRWAYIDDLLPKGDTK